MLSQPIRISQRGFRRGSSLGLTVVVAAISFALLATGCAPEVGSEAWCKQMKETPKGDWSPNEAVDYAKHCVFK